ncbi:MAG TPA: ABC transporter permease [Bacillota bacterium]|nr:ABC transporter permease [Bacillota bacterium]
MNVKRLGRLSLPYLIWMGVLVGLPLLMLVLLSVMDTEGFDFFGGSFTLQNWSNLFSRSNLNILGNTFKFAILATVICFVIGYPMAYIVARSKFANKFIVLVLAIIPMWANSLLRAKAIANLLGSSSLLDSVLSRIGMSFTWNIYGSDLSVVIGLVMTFLPFMILPIYTVIEKLDESLLEAAMDLGANRVKTFFQVTFPLSLKGVVTGVIMVFLPCFSGFVVQDILGRGNSDVIGMVISEFYESNLNFVAVLSLVILVLIFGAMALVNRFDKEGETLL